METAIIIAVISLLVFHFLCAMALIQISLDSSQIRDTLRDIASKLDEDSRGHE